MVDLENMILLVCDICIYSGEGEVQCIIFATWSGRKWMERLLLFGGVC